MSGYYTNNPETGELTLVADKSVGMTGASHTTAGAAGYVPAPQAGDEEKFLRGDGSWVELHGGGGVDIGDVSGEMATTFGTSAFLTWSDPNDIILEGVKLAQWAGTLVVRKAGSAPESKTDGTSVVNNTTRNAYASTPFEDTGLTYGVTYYYRFFPYTKDKRYTDGSSVQITPARQEIYTTPSINETLTYDGTAQTVTITNFDSSKMTKSGDTQTNAGTYTAVVTPKEGYCWSNGSYAPLELSWTIEKDTVDIPSTATSFTYDGTDHSAITEEYDPDLITVTGNTEETDVGSYSFTMALADPDNYDWEDGTTAAKTVSWRILAEALTVPTVTGSFTYDGTEKAPTIGTYDNTKITIVSGDSGTNAGTYNVVFRIIDPSNYIWNDNTSADKEVPWTIAKAQLTAPTVSSSLYYTGTSQNATVSSYDSTLIEVTGTSGTNAGTYTATKHLLDSSNYEWSDGTTTDKTESWSISKATVTPPVVSSTLVYNGSSQNASVSSYDSNIVSVTGTSGTNAGTYTAILSLVDDDNYEWNDHTVADKSATWTISKANGSVTLSSSAVSLDTTVTSDTVTISNATGAITLSSSDTTVATVSPASMTASGGTATISSVNDTTGTATITVSVAESANYNAKTASIAVECTFSSPIYGAQWDGTATTAWSRTDDAVGFTNPNPAVGNGNGSSPFDNIMPWSGLKRVEDSVAGTLVEIPKYYYKWTRSGSSMKLQISMSEFDGCHVSPAHADRGDGKGERDVVYVGAYHCASTYKSTTGVAPLGNVTRANFRTNIHNLGSNIWQYDYAMYWTIMMLYLVEFADWNSQAKIGYGCGNNSSVENNGLTDAMTYHTGTNAASRTTYGHVRYRYIEGLWDNVFDWCDGIYFSSANVYAIKNPANFSDTSGGTSIGTRPTSSNYISAWSNPSASGFEYALYPSAVSGSESSYVCDYCYYDASGVVLFVGGSYYQRQVYGAFYLYGYYKATVAGAGIGGRLQKLP